MRFELLCDRCRRPLDAQAERPLQLVVLVKAGLGPKVPPMPEEVRHRCRSCGFVNVFIPLREAELLRTV